MLISKATKLEKLQPSVTFISVHHHFWNTIVALWKTGAGCGRRASVISWWRSAVPCTISGGACTPGCLWF